MADARVVGRVRARPLLHHGIEGNGVGVPTRRAADQEIVAVAGQEQIRALTTDEQVHSCTGEKDVVAGATEQDVVTAPSFESVVVRAAVQPGRLMDLPGHPEEVIPSLAVTYETASGQDGHL